MIATNNEGKLAELRALLPEGVSLLTMSEAGLDSPVETGSTFVANALLKARHAATSGHVAVADDSGLEVDALHGAPGVRSARFAGPAASDEDNNRLLLDRLTGVAVGRRGARFVSAVALVSPTGREWTAAGTLSGVIADRPRGSAGFGYDPVFQVQDPGAGDYNGRTLAELTPQEKNSVSHRARAWAALAGCINEALRLHAGTEG